MPELQRKPQQRAINTRRQLVKSARTLFARSGYGATSIEEILNSTKVSRGALYHHFDGKRDIFVAVFEQLQRELAEHGRASMEAQRVPGRRLAAAVDGFLDACLDRDMQQIVLLDAPAVIPWDAWNAMQGEHVLAVLESALREAVTAEQIGRQPVEPLAQVLLGMLNAAALRLARAEDLPAERKRVGAAIRRVLAGL